MAHHSAINEQLGISVEGARPDDAGTPAPGAARDVILSRLRHGDIAAALAAAKDLPAARPDPVDMLVDLALADDNAQLARHVLAETEATIPEAQAARIKARIAVSEGELAAAKAILVVAIERHPGQVALRTLLTEVMVAAGTAADARAVLTHIGRPPVNPPAPGTPEAEPDITDTPDTRIG